jgi:cytochrome c553
MSLRLVQPASWLLLGLVLAGPTAVAADRPPAAAKDPAEGAAFFETNIRPILVERCGQCHGAEKTKGGLRLDTKEGLRKGGASGPIVVPGDPEQSRLIVAIRYGDEELKMPPKGRLSDREVARFEEWVRMGAPDPRDDAPPKPSPAIDFDRARKFWSFRPVADPPVPAVADESWPRGDIDHFLLARLEAKGLKPVAPADKRTLIRRATFDLTGLPPTPEEVDAFLADESPHAFETVVERLLASPHYGERWGRHWLDLVRYADTSGCNSDYPVPSAYRYRNYVIDSFNRDKPYDRFLREQIAGDLMPSEGDDQRQEQVVATGYLATARRFGSHNSEFHLTFEDMIDNLGKVTLGLSVSCARCHDHKFDPIPQADYYALYGILDSTKYAFPGTEIYRHTKDFVCLGTSEEAEALRKYEAELADLDARIQKLTIEKKPRAGDGDEARVLRVRADLEEAHNRLRILEDRPPEVEKAYAASEGTPADAKVQRKGDPKNLGESVPRGFLQVLGGQRLSDGAKGSGRLELAGWIADPRNPLTARVMVNRIWQYHFGRGIVPSPNDFGARGKPPTHSELLDWLAARFVEGGWSVKAMHKRIMLSAAYQLSGAEDPTAAAADVNDELLWRFPRRRLSAEEIRDAMLAVGGNLDRTMGGPHPFPPEMGWRYTQHKPFVAVYDTDHRSVYLMQQRFRRHPLLEIFDGPDPNTTTAERSPSTTAIQALFLMNAPLVHEQADRLAVRVALAFPGEAERVDYAHRLAFGRHASADEVDDARRYLAQCRDELMSTGVAWDRVPRAALASYARVLLSSNEFLFVD